MLLRYCTNEEVRSVNQARLAELPGRPMTFTAKDEAGVNSAGTPISVQQATVILDGSTLWPRELTVKVGARVMLLMVRELLFAVTVVMTGPNMCRTSRYAALPRRRAAHRGS
jgi:hypothetical protein